MKRRIGIALVVAGIAAAAVTVHHRRFSAAKDDSFDSGDAILDYPDVTERDAPPSPIKVGPYEYTIRFRPERAMNLFGYLAVTFTTKQVMLVSAGMAPGHLRETVLHEIMHTCQNIKDRMAVDGIEGDGTMTADEFIERTAPELLGVLRDNPELVKWLVKD